MARELAGDDDLSATKLVEVLAHCASKIAVAQYRMMRAASMIHDELAEDHAYECSRTDSGEGTPAQLLDSVAAGKDPYADFGPDGLEQAIAEVDAVLTITSSRAKALIIAGDAARYRLVFTSYTLAEGRIDLDRFLSAVARTDLCSPEAIEDIDAHLAMAIQENPQMPTRSFNTGRFVDRAVGSGSYPQANRT
ncbi:hypothetical protein GII32_01175 [Gordonia amarae]|uniref:DUF222 domain-containing protein n=1 Tax=Gordonia amarae TaxID=36821 RepID=UPI001AF39D8C|nr:DUF222 domain-containing protein [Gordonia amarae]QHN29198.1 hypothetical protein GII32_01175 [Gordonia amarae]